MLWMEMVGVHFWKKQRAGQEPAAAFVPFGGSAGGADQEELCQTCARKSAAPDWAHEYSCARERGLMFNRQV